MASSFADIEHDPIRTGKSIPTVKPQMFFQAFGLLQYYTIWSNWLFYLTLIWVVIGSVRRNLAPPSWFVDAVMANMIAVGIVGNLLLILNNANIVAAIQKKYPASTCAEIANDLAVPNFIYHTLPMVISAVILFTNVGENLRPSSPEKQSHNIWYSFAFLIAFMLAWNLTPYKSKIFIGKIDVVYSNPNLLVVIIAPLVWIFVLVLKMMIYKQ